MSFINGDNVSVHVDNNIQSNEAALSNIEPCTRNVTFSVDVQPRLTPAYFTNIHQPNDEQRNTYLRLYNNTDFTNAPVGIRNDNRKRRRFWSDESSSSVHAQNFYKTHENCCELSDSEITTNGSQGSRPGSDTTCIFAHPVQQCEYATDLLQRPNSTLQFEPPVKQFISINGGPGIICVAKNDPDCTRIDKRNNIDGILQASDETANIELCHDDVGNPESNGYEDLNAFHSASELTLSLHDRNLSRNRSNISIDVSSHKTDDRNINLNASSRIKKSNSDVYDYNPTADSSRKKGFCHCFNSLQKDFTNETKKSNCLTNEMNKTRGEKNFSTLNSQHFAKAGRYLRNMKYGEIFYDVKFEVLPRTFYAHRVALACHSQYFEQLFAMNSELINYKLPMEVQIHGITAEAFEIVLLYVYEGVIDLPPELIPEVIDAASKFRISPLLDSCYEKMDSLSPETALRFLLRISTGEFHLIAYSVVLDSFCDIVSSSYFLLLDIETLIKILSSDRLNSPSEMLVFNVIMNWIRSDDSVRSKYVQQLLACVRFSLMSPQDLLICSQSYLFHKYNADSKRLRQSNWVLTVKAMGIEDPFGIDVDQPRIRFSINSKTDAKGFGTGDYVMNLRFNQENRSAQSVPHKRSSMLECDSRFNTKSPVRVPITSRQQYLYKHTDQLALIEDTWMNVVHDECILQKEFSLQNRPTIKSNNIGILKKTHSAPLTTRQIEVHNQISEKSQVKPFNEHRTAVYGQKSTRKELKLTPQHDRATFAKASITQHPSTTMDSLGIEKQLASILDQPYSFNYPDYLTSSSTIAHDNNKCMIVLPITTQQLQVHDQINTLKKADYYKNTLINGQHTTDHIRDFSKTSGSSVSDSRHVTFSHKVAKSVSNETLGQTPTNAIEEMTLKTKSCVVTPLHTKLETGNDTMTGQSPDKRRICEMASPRAFTSITDHDRSVLESQLNSCLISKNPKGHQISSSDHFEAGRIIAAPNKVVSAGFESRAYDSRHMLLQTALGQRIDRPIGTEITVSDLEFLAKDCFKKWSEYRVNMLKNQEKKHGILTDSSTIFCSTNSMPHHKNKDVLEFPVRQTRGIRPVSVDDNKWQLPKEQAFISHKNANLFTTVTDNNKPKSTGSAYSYTDGSGVHIIQEQSAEMDIFPQMTHQQQIVSDSRHVIYAHKVTKSVLGQTPTNAVEEMTLKTKSCLVTPLSTTFETSNDTMTGQSLDTRRINEMASPRAFTSITDHDRSVLESQLYTMPEKELAVTGYTPSSMHRIRFNEATGKTDSGMAAREKKERDIVQSQIKQRDIQTTHVASSPCRMTDIPGCDKSNAESQLFKMATSELAEYGKTPWAQHRANALQCEHILHSTAGKGASGMELRMQSYTPWEKHDYAIKNEQDVLQGRCGTMANKDLQGVEISKRQGAICKQNASQHLLLPSNRDAARRGVYNIKSGYSTILNFDAFDKDIHSDHAELPAVRKTVDTAQDMRQTYAVSFDITQRENVVNYDSRQSTADRIDSKNLELGELIEDSYRHWAAYRVQLLQNQEERYGMLASQLNLKDMSSVRKDKKIPSLLTATNLSASRGAIKLSFEMTENKHWISDNRHVTPVKPNVVTSGYNTNTDIPQRIRYDSAVKSIPSYQSAVNTKPPVQSIKPMQFTPDTCLYNVNMVGKNIGQETFHENMPNFRTNSVQKQVIKPDSTLLNSCLISKIPKGHQISTSDHFEAGRIIAAPNKVVSAGFESRAYDSRHMLLQTDLGQRIDRPIGTEISVSDLEFLAKDCFEKWPEYRVNMLKNQEKKHGILTDSSTIFCSTNSMPRHKNKDVLEFPVRQTRGIRPVSVDDNKWQLPKEQAFISHKNANLFTTVTDNNKPKSTGSAYSYTDGSDVHIIQEQSAEIDIFPQMTHQQQIVSDSRHVIYAHKVTKSVSSETLGQTPTNAVEEMTLKTKSCLVTPLSTTFETSNDTMTGQSLDTRRINEMASPRAFTTITDHDRSVLESQLYTIPEKELAVTGYTPSSMHRIRFINDEDMQLTATGKANSGMEAREKEERYIVQNKIKQRDMQMPRVPSSHYTMTDIPGFDKSNAEAQLFNVATSELADYGITPWAQHRANALQCEDILHSTAGKRASGMEMRMQSSATKVQNKINQNQITNINVVDKQNIYSLNNSVQVGIDRSNTDSQCSQIRQYVDTQSSYGAFYKSQSSGMPSIIQEQSAEMYISPQMAHQQRIVSDSRHSINSHKVTKCVSNETLGQTPTRAAEEMTVRTKSCLVTPWGSKIETSNDTMTGQSHDKRRIYEIASPCAFTTITDHDRSVLESQLYTMPEKELAVTGYTPSSMHRIRFNEATGKTDSGMAAREKKETDIVQNQIKQRDMQMPRVPSSHYTMTDIPGFDRSVAESQLFNVATSELADYGITPWAQHRANALQCEDILHSTAGKRASGMELRTQSYTPLIDDRSNADSQLSRMAQYVDNQSSYGALYKSQSSHIPSCPSRMTDISGFDRSYAESKLFNVATSELADYGITPWAQHRANALQCEDILHSTAGKRASGMEMRMAACEKEETDILKNQIKQRNIQMTHVASSHYTMTNIPGFDRSVAESQLFNVATSELADYGITPWAQHRANALQCEDILHSTAGKRASGMELQMESYTPLIDDRSNADSQLSRMAQYVDNQSSYGALYKSQSSHVRSCPSRMTDISGFDRSDADSKLFNVATSELADYGITPWAQHRVNALESEHILHSTAGKRASGMELQMESYTPLIDDRSNADSQMSRVAQYVDNQSSYGALYKSQSSHIPSCPSRMTDIPGFDRSDAESKLFNVATSELADYGITPWAQHRVNALESEHILHSTAGKRASGMELQMESYTPLIDDRSNADSQLSRMAQYVDNQSSYGALYKSQSSHIPSCPSRMTYIPGFDRSDAESKLFNVATSELADYGITPWAQHRVNALESEHILHSTAGKRASGMELRIDDSSELADHGRMPWAQHRHTDGSDAKIIQTQSADMDIYSQMAHQQQIVGEQPKKMLSHSGTHMTAEFEDQRLELWMNEDKRHEFSLSKSSPNNEQSFSRPYSDFCRVDTFRKHNVIEQLDDSLSITPELENQDRSLARSTVTFTKASPDKHQSEQRMKVDHARLDSQTEECIQNQYSDIFKNYDDKFPINEPGTEEDYYTQLQKAAIEGIIRNNGSKENIRSAETGQLWSKVRSRLNDILSKNYYDNMKYITIEGISPTEHLTILNNVPCPFVSIATKVMQHTQRDDGNSPVTERMIKPETRPLETSNIIKSRMKNLECGSRDQQLSTICTNSHVEEPQVETNHLTFRKSDELISKPQTKPILQKSHIRLLANQKSCPHLDQTDVKLHNFRRFSFDVDGAFCDGFLQSDKQKSSIKLESSIRLDPRNEYKNRLDGLLSGVEMFHRTPIAMLPAFEFEDESSPQSGSSEVDDSDVQQSLQDKQPHDYSDKDDEKYDVNSLGDILIIGGHNAQTINFMNDSVTYKYSRFHDKWASFLKLPEPRRHHSAAILGTYLYLVGGCSTKDASLPEASNFQFCCNTKQWTVKASMNRRRMYHRLCCLVGLVYAVGGMDEFGEVLKSVECYSTGNDTWKFTTNMSVPRIYPAVAACNDRLFVAGGYGEWTEKEDCRPLLNSVERYNPLTNQWSSVCGLPIARYHANMINVNNTLYIIGGAAKTGKDESTLKSLTRLDRYIPAENKWHHVTDMVTPRHAAGSTVVGNKIYIVGGVSCPANRFVQSIEVYDTEQGAWCHSMPFACRSFDCVVLPTS